MSETVVRILIVTLLNIGDVLFASPALRSVREAYPDAQIDMLVKHVALETVVHNPCFENVFSVDPKALNRSPRSFLCLIRQLKSRRYDMLISLHACARVTLIAALSGARRKAGLASHGFEWLFDTPTRQRGDIHRVKSYLEVVRDIGINPLEHARMEMWVDDVSCERANEVWCSASLGDVRTAVGLNPGARVAIRLWPARSWAELADRLNRQGASAVILGGPGDVEMAREITSTMETESPVFTGRLTLLELAAVLKKCAALVTGDTGPMHIAASQSTPVVALFGPTDPAITGPYAVTNIVLKSANPCSGCRAVSADPTRHTCMTDISVQEVFDRAVRLLANRG